MSPPAKCPLGTPPSRDADVAALGTSSPLPADSPYPPTSRTEERPRTAPLWRDLIMRVWGEDPMICPCCKGTMKTAGTMIRREEVQFFLQLHGLWEGILALPPPPDPPFGGARMG